MNARPTPSAVLEELRKSHPLLSLGVEQRGALLSLHKTAQQRVDMPWLAPSVIMWAFQRTPLDPETARKAASAPAAGPVTAGADHAAAAALAGAVSTYFPESGAGEQEDLKVLGDVLDRYDIKLLTRFLLPRMADADRAFPLLAGAWDRLVKCTSGDLPLTMLEAAAFPPELASLKDRLRAEWGMYHVAPDNPDAARELLESCDDAVWGGWKQSMRAMLLAGAGKTAEAAAIHTRLARDMPWHVNACLMAHSLQAVPEDSLFLSEGVTILLYSWNKSRLLEQTLDSLYASNIGKARIVILDNGSTDAMPRVLEAATHRFGADRFSHIRLPVNIGAPGARNWLLTLPQVRERPYAAFLDDDVILPQNWLARLLGASLRLSSFGAVGCRIVSAEKPHALQSADYNNYPLDTSEDGRRLGFFDNCFGQLDMGMYGYDRPCLSVSGCCHLLNMRAVDEAGLFDISYNPTQFDDLDRDLRSCLAGFPSYYAGSLRVRHIQHSSMEKATTLAGVGQVSGNQMKLQGRFEDGEIMRLFDLSQALLWSDLLYKAKYLEDM